MEAVPFRKRVLQLIDDPDGLLIGPVGDPINLVPSADLSAPAELIQFEFDVSIIFPSELNKIEFENSFSFANNDDITETNALADLIFDNFPLDFTSSL